MTAVDITELAAIPYLDASSLPGRFLVSLTFFDEGWHMWMDATDGKLIKVQGWPAESTYFAVNPENPNDLHFHFVDLIVQRANFSPLARALAGIQDDIYNLSASLAKLHWMHDARNSIPNGLSRMAATEIEYIFGVCRSIFDLWQEILCGIWDKITLLDNAVTKKPLKESFREMLFFKGEAATADVIAERFGLPRPLAECYARAADFFLKLRAFRDNVLHRGSRVQTIFVGEKDFTIQRALIPFRDLDLWREDEREPNNLVPLSPALGFVIYKTLKAFDSFSRALESNFQLPPPVVPGMRYFMRGYFDEGFLRRLQDVEQRVGACRQ